MGNSQTCSICSAPAEVQSAVNMALRKRERLRDIQARAGFSRSALSRHSIKCLGKQILDEHKTAFFNHKTDSAWIEWPDSPPGLSIVAENLAGQARPTVPRTNDVVLRIAFEAPVEPRAPKPVAPEDTSKLIGESF